MLSGATGRKKGRFRAANDLDDAGEVEDVKRLFCKVEKLKFSDDDKIEFDVEFIPVFVTITKAPNPLSLQLKTFLYAYCFEFCSRHERSSLSS